MYCEIFCILKFIYYRDKHKNRTLKWMYTMSQADVKTVATTKLYLLHVTTFQLGILLIFNEQDQCSFKELVSTTGLDAKEVMKEPVLKNYFLNSIQIYCSKISHAP